jgi:hypothetical protein
MLTELREEIAFRHARLIGHLLDLFVPKNLPQLAGRHRLIGAAADPGIRHMPEPGIPESVDQARQASALALAIALPLPLPGKKLRQDLRHSRILCSGLLLLSQNAADKIKQTHLNLRFCVCGCAEFGGQHRLTSLCWPALS